MFGEAEFEISRISRAVDIDIALNRVEWKNRIHVADPN